MQHDQRDMAPPAHLLACRAAAQSFTGQTPAFLEFRLPAYVRNAPPSWNFEMASQTPTISENGYGGHKM